MRGVGAIFSCLEGRDSTPRQTMHMSPILYATAMIVCFCGSNGSQTADSAAAGQRVFESRCASCHRLQDFAGQSRTQLDETLMRIVGGTVVHPQRLTLSAGEVNDLAAYLADSNAK